jgi:hypothetical protein
MKVIKITFEQLFPTGAYANQRLGIEIDVSDSLPSDLVGHYQYAMDKVNSAFKALNPDLTTNTSIGEQSFSPEKIPEVQI